MTLKISNMKKNRARFLLLFTMLAAFQEMTGEERVVFNPVSPTKGIQEAIDKASGNGGGTVFIPKGTYPISCSIIIPKSGNLTICGEGASTIIEVEKEYKAFASTDLKKGDLVVSVKDPGNFKLHDKVVILDDQQSGEHGTTIAKISGKKGNSIMLDTPLRNTYKVSDNARIIHTFHIMTTEGFSSNIIVPNIVVRDLQFCGGLKKEFQGFHFWNVNGGVVLMGENIRVENCIVRDIPADGIFVGGGLIQKENFWVKGCLVENAGERGIHIGNDPRNVTISDNHFKKIGGIGIYLCHGSQRTIITGNTICDIGYFETASDTIYYLEQQGVKDDEYRIKTKVAGIGGIGGGGRRSFEHDKYVIISNNIIYNSTGSGISFLKWFQEEGGRPGENMIISGNIIYNIEQSGLFIFAAQSINASDNSITDCLTGIDCSESVYCFFTSNTVRNCKTAFRFYSTDEKFLTTRNVSGNNMIINCLNPLSEGKGAIENINTNHIISY